MKRLLTLCLFFVACTLRPLALMDDKKLDLVDIRSNYVTITELSQGQSRQLFSKNGDAKMSPASMTKLMTAYLAYQKVNDLDQKIIIKPEDVAGLKEEKVAVVGFEAGEEVTVRDLYYATLLTSGADASNVLARLSHGSVTAFVDGMNQMAKDLQMSRTHFLNCSGLYDVDHYSTVNDISRLLSQVLQEPFLKEVLSTFKYVTSTNSIHPSGLNVHSTLLSYAQYHTDKIGYIQGGKTGWVPQSGFCLASFSQALGKTVLVVSGDAYAHGDQLEDHNHYYKLLFDHKRPVTILSKDKPIGSISLLWHKPTEYPVFVDEDVVLDLPLLLDKEDVRLDHDFKEAYPTPVHKGDRVGTIRLCVEEECLLEKDVTFHEDIHRSFWLFMKDSLSHWFFGNLFFSLFFLGLFFILLAILSVFLYRSYRQEKRQKDDYRGYHF